MSTPRTRRLARALAVTSAAALAVTMSSGSALAGGHGHGHGHGHGKPDHRPPFTQIQLLSFNDFHGNLEAPSGSGGRLTTGYTETQDPKTLQYSAKAQTVDAGGVEYLATHLKQARQGHANTVTVAAGDLIGASPLLSAAFHDEPTIEAMNALGLDASAVGNHEFDEGYKELQRMQSGGCIDDGTGANNQNSCADHEFEGADFTYLAANVKYSGTNKTILPPYWIKTFADGAKVGFIGMTLKDTPTIVTKSGVEGLTFTDEAQTANALVPVLRRQGVKAIVVLIHQGGTPATTTYTAEHGTYNVAPPFDATCSTETKDGVKGAQLTDDSPILDITRKLDPQIDMVISGHTHQPYICSQLDPSGELRLITSASSFGRLFTQTNLTYNLRSGDIQRSSVEGTNVVVTRDVVKDPQETSIISTYNTLVQPIANKVIGNVAGGVTLAKTSSLDPETALGRLIADAQKNDASLTAGGGAPAQIAFMNPGGIRTDLVPLANGDVTFGAAFSVQPFNNYVVAMDMTGQQILDLLEQQWSGGNATSPKILQVSEGFTYSWSASAPAGSKVDPASVKLNGTVIDPAATYRVAANSFLSDGGDNFPSFAAATNKYIGGLDIDAFASYLTAKSPYQPIATDRITQTP
ncbi:bifunctional UDP-sugar hydrolase/5'-nucleotidase [Angustibacter sp. Root456]|uniref:bifunctional metallophosphatase/5'-nucleotidase n=1 Tax=Angustibacter sp. Root456 TaxID=1736539 RepID=UPI000701C064|nr:bifunctional metallophosphatase/5'-nucleotidase [Angustibacter sp. Root456]KQX61605.1 multifunctional 2',3'-cyclic-nucleotide 2'-phosphodiesterase/5'-nucleotidase/3'-nucleotidase [Angustibacter sp. Root456]